MRPKSTIDDATAKIKEIYKVRKDELKWKGIEETQDALLLAICALSLGCSKFYQCNDLPFERSEDRQLCSKSKMTYQ